jgi:hypothetical protein
VKNSLRRAPVAARIVQDALLDTIRTDDIRMKFIAVQRQRKNSREAGTIQNERARRQFRHRHVLQIVVKKSLDALVNRAEIMAEQAILLPRLSGHRGDDFGELGVALNRHGRASDQGKFDIDVGYELCWQFIVHLKTFPQCLNLQPRLNPLPLRCLVRGVW